MVIIRLKKNICAAKILKCPHLTSPKGEEPGTALLI